MMNSIRPIPYIRPLVVSLALWASGAAQAQTPPTWLNWDHNTPPPATTSAAHPVNQAAAGVSPPPSTPPLGAGDSATGSSGQAVIIQNLLEGVSSLQQQVRDLRGQVEEQDNKIQRLSKAQQSGFSSFDERLNKLEQGGAGTVSPAAPVAPTAPTPPAAAAVTPAAPVPPTAAPAPAADNEKQQALYNAAFVQLKDGHYDQAIAGFQAAIDAAPQGQWTPSALFWQGETYYVLQKRAQADAAYQKILTDFPKSDRVPDALLKTGYIAYDEKKNSQARSIFEKVVSQYPSSQAANLAKQRLARMTAEKR